MTIAQSLPLVESHVNPEIIFPEGQFWSDEPLYHPQCRWI